MFVAYVKMVVKTQTILRGNIEFKRMKIEKIKKAWTDMMRERVNELVHSKKKKKQHASAIYTIDKDDVVADKIANGYY